MTKILNITNQHGGFSSLGRSRSDTLGATVPPGEVFHSSRLTILSSNLDANASIALQPERGQTGNVNFTVNWKTNLFSTIQYQIEAFSCSPDILTSPDAPSVTRQMTGFLPSRNGLHFDNAFPPVPDLILKTPLGDVNIGNAANGLCGGMVYAALDYYNAGRPVPSDTNPPSRGVLFDYIVKRLFSSFDLPAGVLKFIDLMNPGLPDGQVTNTKFGTTLYGRAWQMIRQEWPVIKTKLDAGQGCPLGLVRVKSTDLQQLGDNHQILTYGYDLVGDELTLFIYDPNYHDDDGITLKINISDPKHATAVTYSTGETAYCFFHTNYAVSVPPGG